MSRHSFLTPRLAVFFAGMLTAALAGPQAALAQDYPSKPIRLISPFAAGGGSDFVARYLAAKISVAAKVPVIVENKVGAGGVLGTDHVAKSAPDGYTVLMGSNGPLALFPALGTKMPYDPQRDFAPVALLTKQPFVVLANANLPVRTFRELLDYARARPGQLNYGTPGSGSAPHLAIEMLAQQAGMRMTHVPYKGGPPALNDLVAGQIQLATADPNTAAPLAKQGRIRALAVTTATRSPAFPDVPTVAESGVPGYEVSGWFGALVPGATPAATVERLHGLIARAMNAPEAREALGGLGGELLATTPAEFAAFIRSESSKWQTLIKTLNIKADN